MYGENCFGLMDASGALAPLENFAFTVGRVPVVMAVRYDYVIRLYLIGYKRDCPASSAFIVF